MKAPAGSAARSYRVVALGDSAPAGFSCDCSSFVRLYALHILQDTGVAATATNDAEPSALSGDDLAQLQGSSDVARAVARADFVVVNVGANDFAQDRVGYEQGACGGADHLGCFRPQLPRMHDNLVGILQRVRSLVGARPVALRVVDYWNVFEDGDVGRANGDAFVRDSDRLTRLVDDQICAAAHSQGAVCVRTYAAFKGGDRGDRDATALLASDGDHPNAAGHRLITRLVAAAG